MDLKSAVRKAAAKNGITGVLQMRDHCGLSYERTRRVWEGITTAKIQDVEAVMKSLGYVVSFRKVVDL